MRWFVVRPTLSAALLLALFVVGFLFEALLGGEMLSPLAALYGQVPWQFTAPDDFLDYFNPLLSDIAQSHHPWNAFAREQIHDGVFPAWNPHVLAGVPFFANPQTVLLSPFSLPLWILPLNYGIGVSAALKLWAAGFGTYLLVRELKLGFLPALLAAIAYMLCSFNVVWLTHESLPGVSAMLPWMLWLADRTVRRGSLGAGIGLALVTGIAIVGGHPGTQVHVLAATALYAALCVAFLPDLEPWTRARRLGLAAGGIAVGLLLAAVMFFPEVLSSRGTIGTVARAEGGQPGTGMPLTAAHSILFPDWWGRPSGLSATTVPTSASGNLVAVNFNERTFFAGVVALLLACIALTSRTDWRRKAPFAVLAVLAIAIVLRAPGLDWLVTHLPPFDVIQNQRAHFVFELGVAVLAAFGLHALIGSPARDTARRLAVALGALAFALVVMVTIEPSGRDIGDVVEHFTTGAEVTSDIALRLTAATWLMLLAGAVVVALLALQRRPQLAAAIGVGLVLLVAVDMIRFAGGYQTIGPASKVIPESRPSIAYLQRHADDTRFLGLGTALTPDWSLMYGLHDVRGYDPPFPTLRYYDLWRTANPTQTNWQSLQIEGLSVAGLRVASVLGAGYVIAAPGAETPGAGDERELRLLRRVYTARDATIFENPLAAPRVLVPAQVDVADDAQAARAAIVAEGFDPTTMAVVERDEIGDDAAALTAASGDSSPGEVTIAGEENAEVRLDARLERRALVALNESMIDGWSVEVDGESVEAVHVNTVMRGVVVDAGRHEIVWRYDVPGMKAGLVVSLLSAAVLAVGLVVVVRTRRRREADAD